VCIAVQIPISFNEMISMGGGNWVGRRNDERRAMGHEGLGTGRERAEGHGGPVDWRVLGGEPPELGDRPESGGSRRGDAAGPGRAGIGRASGGHRAGVERRTADHGPHGSRGLWGAGGHANRG